MLPNSTRFHEKTLYDAQSTSLAGVEFHSDEKELPKRFGRLAWEVVAGPRKGEVRLTSGPVQKSTSSKSFEAEVLKKVVTGFANTARDRRVEFNGEQVNQVSWTLQPNGCPRRGSYKLYQRLEKR